MGVLDTLNHLAAKLDHGIQMEKGPKVNIRDRKKIQENIEAIVRIAALSDEPERSAARWLVRECALQMGILLASIHELYSARGRGEVRDDFTVPAMNLRALPYDAAKAVFDAAKKIDAKALIFEIARSEMGYTNQQPAEYVATILGAAIATGYEGPVFVQGDHYQVSPKKYKTDPEAELSALRSLALESIRAGFFNIDIDTSTLVDLSKKTIGEQQELNCRLSAELAAFIRKHEPAGLIISLGGEIGEVGGQNRTEPELRAYMDGFNKALDRLAPKSTGLSKISIQTGTTHGGVVLPDGSIAQVKVDFNILQKLSAVAKEYSMGGTVQHGASTLPVEAFSRFPESNALEVHLATGFQNLMYDRLPRDLEREMYTYLDEHHGDERKSGQTDEQFYYQARKRALGPFKKDLWNMSLANRKEIGSAWESQFDLLFDRLNIGGTKDEVGRHVHAIPIHEPIASFIGEDLITEKSGDLAD
jgi:fructose/tagatose bisphosphate aldolase